MKYKLLTRNGLHFVFLEDGTVIPRQVNTSVSQRLREKPVATVVALFGPMFSGDVLRLEKAALFLNGKELDNLLLLEANMYADPHKAWDVKFSVEVELIDTIEQPKMPNL